VTRSCLIAEEQRQLLQRAGFTKIQCINYLDPEMAKGEEGRADWQHREYDLFSSLLASAE
jgi:hypothetical protein